MLFLRTLEILTVGSTLWRAHNGIVMGFKDLMNEGNHFIANFAASSTVVIVGKKTKETTSILCLSLSIPLRPTLSGSYGNRCSVFGNLTLLLIIVLLRMDDPVAEDSSSQVILTCPFQESLSFGTHARSTLRWNCKGGAARLSGNARLMPRTPDWRVPRLREPMSSQVNIEGMFSDGYVDEISWNVRCHRSKIRESDPRILINKLVKPLQDFFRDNKLLQVLVVVF